jgi:uncharacterized protein with NRDE domain
MCIVLIATTHPQYPIIVLDNRDEYFNRPTAPVAWHGDVLAAQDLQRAVHGSWMGVTKAGRIAVLVNIHQSGPTQIGTQEAVSRGAMVKAWLEAETEDVRTWAKETLGDGKGETVGGFTMLIGVIRRMEEGIEPLHVISNKPLGLGDELEGIVGRKGVVESISNATFGDDPPWPKITRGSGLLRAAIEEHKAKYNDSQRTEKSETALIDLLFNVLNDDTMPRSPQGTSVAEAGYNFRKSVFIPVVGVTDSEHQGPSSGRYGTTQQTVLLVANSGRVTYVEKTVATGHQEHVEFELANF